MKKQKKINQSTKVSKSADYIRLIELTKDLTDIEVRKVREFVLTLKSQRIQ